MISNSAFVLILAGGAGTRFWPASREHLPKQFLDITGSGKSLIRQTVDRFLQLIPAENIFVITHTSYIHLVSDALPELAPHQIMAEPTRNNTAPSIALASLKLSKLNPEAVCIVAPADHIIDMENEFENVIGVAVEHARLHNSIITLGIEPTRPDTGYGYIEFDTSQKERVRKVLSFREKPDLATAAQYIRRGGFAWNAGIFIWKLSTILNSFERYAPQIYSTLIAGKNIYNTPDENAFIEKSYPLTEKISVDYAILEKSPDAHTIPCDIGWSDIGTWNSLYDHSAKDAAGNVKFSQDVYTEQSSNNLIRSAGKKLVVIKDLHDFIIVDTKDCLLIYPRSDEQQIKELKERLKARGFESFL